ncbi:MAG: hypothetical protein HUK14_04350 [Muribaculaceae bacterium]|nr:hypothetical protein [Muribaculaceae bacterium]
MRRLQSLYEDKRCKRLPVWFIPTISQKIASITEYNKQNIISIKQWKEYIDGIKSYISNSVIAWDNMNRYPLLPNGAKFNNDFNSGIGYTIKFNKYTKLPYVCVFMINLKLDEYGLKDPSKITESKRNNTMNRTRKRIRLTEGQLKRIIKESLNELGYSHWPLQDDERQLPKGYDDEWEEDNNFKDMFGPGRYGSPYYRTNDRLEHLNGYVPDDERRRDMRRDWEDQKFNDFQRLRYNSPWQGANPNVKTITDSDGDHIALNDYDAARRARGEHVPVRSSGPSAFDSPGRALYNDYGEYMGVTESIRRAIRKVLR